MSPWITRVGAGPDLVLIHGWAMHGGIFAPLVDRLAAHFCLHLVDMPVAATTSRISPDRCNPRNWPFASPSSRRRRTGLAGRWADSSPSCSLRRPNRFVVLVALPRQILFSQRPDWPHGVAAQVFADFGNALMQDFVAAIERFLALETLGSANAQDELRQTQGTGVPR